jgi:hypothetical protein
MLDLKFLTPRKDDNKCKLVIKGDWNDADYITEVTSFTVDKINSILPYLSILLDLFKFDNDFRRKFNYSDRVKKYGYRIDIREDFESALEFYFNYKRNFYLELLNLKNDNKNLSNRLTALNEDKFEDVHEATLQDIKDNLIDNHFEILPHYEGSSIHTIKEIYIDYKGNKYDIQSDKTLEAFADLMDREYDNFYWPDEDK